MELGQAAVTQLELLDRAGKVTELARARHEAEDGMARALDHAEMDCPGWADIAFHFLHNYAMTHQYFISEDVSDASKVWGMVQPATDKAWGSVYRRAIKDGVIVKDGAGISRRRHASICPRWLSLVFRSAA